jgi:murein DD-endopeptidase MepM/ murein hydrolase activator NlpD
LGSHVISPGETLGVIALSYGLTAEELAALNGLDVDAMLAVGQVLLVPGEAILYSPSFKIIPDSELVYGPAARDFRVGEVARTFGGYLAGYTQEVEGQTMTGPEIVQLVADRFSLGPRVLLAALEYRSGWLTQAAPTDDGFPMGYSRTGYEGLYQQLGWAADQLNLGYYGRSEGGISSFEIGDTGQTIQFAPDINHGTAGIQMLFARFPSISIEAWSQAVGPAGFFATYQRLFGNPFAYAVEPLWPAALVLPELALPWAAGETWYYTGGPHGGWASGSAWAAIDFAPPDNILGCYTSESWVRSMSDGLVVRSGHGAVVVDLDGDGYAGTGWAITYMHLETRDRVAPGTTVRPGDPLGHPSCEGGYSNGTHVHITRTFNGRWVSADGPYPYQMGGWLSQGLGQEYNGLLVNGAIVKEAYEGRVEGNAITAE